ncbi:MAG: hypothetical protein H6915_05330 [Novosphingobium sp.]|nr:hypothetical protein [Novosphingobium sp.]
MIEWYCRECYDSYKKEQHDLFVDLFQKFIFVALIIGVIIFLNYKFRNEIDTENLNSPQMEMTSESYEIIGAEVDTPENVMEDYTAAMPSESQGTSMQAREEMEATELNVPDLERLETSHALKKAISKALGSGEAQRWSAYGSAGYVVVSAVEPQSGCRSLYYSIDTERPAWQSETRTVCPDER